MAFGRRDASPDETLKEALKADPKPVVFVTGGLEKSGVEPWHVDAALVKLTEHALAGASRDFNLDRLRAEESSAEIAVSRAETLPMMAKRRVVTVTDIDRWKAADQEKFVAYLKRPADTTVMILTALKLDRRTVFAKALEALPQVWRFRKLEGPELVRALIAHAKQQKKSLAPAAAEEMVRRAGEDFRLLRTELDKLVAYVGPENDAITEDDVAMATAGAGMSDVFAFADALGKGDLGRALERLQIVLDAGSSAFELIGGLGWHFRMMLKAKGGNAPPYGRMKEIAETARTFPTRALLAAHREIYRAEVTLKSAHGPTGLKDEAVMDRLTRRICELRRAA